MRVEHGDSTLHADPQAVNGYRGGDLGTEW